MNILRLCMVLLIYVLFLEFIVRNVSVACPVQLIRVVMEHLLREVTVSILQVVPQMTVDDSLLIMVTGKMHQEVGESSVMITLGGK